MALLPSVIIGDRACWRGVVVDGSVSVVDAGDNPCSVAVGAGAGGSGGGGVEGSCACSDSLRRWYAREAVS